MKRQAFWIQGVTPDTYRLGGEEKPCKRNIQIGVVATTLKQALSAAQSNYPDAVFHAINKRGDIDIVVASES